MCEDGLCLVLDIKEDDLILSVGCGPGLCWVLSYVQT